MVPLAACFPLPRLRYFALPGLLFLFAFAGCAAPQARTPAPDLKATARTIRAATADIAQRAIEIEKASRAAHEAALQIRDGLVKCGTEGKAALPPSAPAPLRSLADDILREAARVNEALLPRIDEALAAAEAVRARTCEISGPVLDELLRAEEATAALARERDEAAKDRDRWKERATSAVRRWLAAVAIGSFAALLGSVALAVYVSRRAGLLAGLGSLLSFACAVALSRWYEYFEWAGLAVILLAVGALGYLVWRHRRAFVQVVAGGESVKDRLEELVANFKPDQIVAALASAGADVRGWFNKIQAAMQDPATRAMVRKAKKKGDGETGASA